MFEKKKNITFMLLAEIMLLLAFFFFLLLVVQISKNDGDDSDKLILTNDFVSEHLDLLPNEVEVPEVWNELTFSKYTGDVRGQVNKIRKENNTLRLGSDKYKKKQESLLAQVKSLQKENKSLKKQVALTKGDACLQLDQQVEICKGLLERAIAKHYPGEHQEVVKQVLAGDKNLDQSLLNKWDAPYGMRSCWVEDKNLAAHKIEYPMTAELYDEHIILRRRWGKDRNNVAKALNFTANLDKKLSIQEFKALGQQIIRISKTAGKGTDWYQKDVGQCRFFLYVDVKTELNKTMRVLDEYFYKFILN